MSVRLIVASLVVSTTLLAQDKPPSCPADRPIDDILAEIHKLQKPKRNKNPLPENICAFGWCRKGRGQTSGKPAPETSEAKGTPASGESSSKPADQECNEAMELALDAAHDVEVGDYYFTEEKSYKPALFRYQDATKKKPSDAAILVRLGRTYERLNQRADALESYQAAAKLAGPEKYLQEAQAAIVRLQTK